MGRIAGGLRTYRVSRILQLDVLDGCIEPAETFDLRAYWTENARRFEASQHPERATLRLSPWGIKMMKAFLSPFALAGATISEPGDDGWRTVDLPVAPVRHAAYELLRFGAEAEVVAPEALRMHMARIAGQLACMYADATADAGAA